MELRKLTAHQLYDWTNSDEYNSLPDVPVSRLRALSYIKNPKLQKDDIIAYLLFENKVLIAFRTLLPDTLTINCNEINIYWFSGSWTHENKRRNGLVSILLDEIIKDKGHCQGASNWAPVSKKVYDKSNYFTTYKQEGIRCYLKFNIAGLFASRITNRLFVLFLKLSDYALNSVLFFYFLYKKHKYNKISLNFEFLNTPDIQCNSLMQKLNCNELNKRNLEMFNWIKAYPWIIQVPFMSLINKRYYFSSTSLEFNQFVIKCYDGTNTIGFALISIRDGFLKIPYFYAEQQYISEILEIILHIAYSSNVSVLTTSHPYLVTLLKDKKYNFLSKRKFNHDFLFSKELFNKFPTNVFFQDGDADGVFT